MSDFRVVVCGGGIAAVEGLLRLRRLAGDSVDIELVAPNDELAYRPMAVRQPFAFGPPRRYPLRVIARDTGAAWAQDSLAWVDPSARSVHTASGRSVQYDALLVAVGARQMEPYEHVATFRDADADAAYQGVVQDIEGGYARRLAFIQPVGPVWPLPLYELALMTAERAESMDIRDLRLSLVTPEPRPLAVFGTAVSEVVTNRLARAGVKVYTDSLAKVPAKRKLVIQPQNIELEEQRIVTMPRVAGPSIRGLPGGGAHGFIPIDEHARVVGLRDVYCAGDAANYPVKQGGLAAQQADAAALLEAARAGAAVRAEPFRPVLRGRLMTGDGDEYFVRELRRPVGRLEEGRLWWPPTKVSGRYLTPWIASEDPGVSAPELTQGAPIERELPSDPAAARREIMSSLGPPVPQRSWG